MKQIDYLRKSRKNCSALLMACALTFMLLTTTLSFAQTNSLTLGCPTASGNSYQYSALSLTAGDGVVRSISISFSENPDGCSISLPSTSWTVSGNEYSRYIIPAEGATSAQIEAFLQGVIFNVPSGTLKGVNIILSIDNASRQVFYFAGNGHYYEYVPYTGTKSWTDAYNEAKGLEYCGRPGYLATLTTAEEDAFVTRIVQNAMWIGGTRLSPTDDATSTGTQYYANFDTDDEVNEDNTDYWYWACGPEKGARITNEGAITNSNEQLSWYTQQPREPNGYTNWMYAVGRVTGSMYSAEPNNSGNESCLTVLRLGLHEGAIYTRKSENTSTTIGNYVFGWNDVTYEGNNSSSAWKPQGYLVEYGDQSIGHSQTDEACSISASGLVGNATRTVKATLSGSTAVCAGKEATLNIIFEDGAFPFTGSVQGNNGAVVHTFNTNDISYNFTVAPTATTSYTISTFSDASSTTGSNGCLGVYSIVYEKSGSATVTVNTPQVALNDIESVAICAGASTTLTATTTETVTGEVSYEWSPATGLSATTGATVTANPSATTTYTVTATATQGECTATATKEVTVRVNELPTATISVTDVKCKGAGDGIITVNADGGSGSYQYQLGTGVFQNSNEFTGLNVGSYTLTVKDGNSCTTTTTATIDEPAQLTLTIVSATDETCKENNDGTIAYTVGGGTPNYTVTFAEGISATKSAAGTYTQSDLSAGDYVVKVVDHNGCSVTAPAVTIDEPATLEIHQEGDIKSAQCKGDNNGQFAFSIAGGNGTNTITINGGAVTLATPSEGVYTQTGLAAGTYTVSVTDNKGCSATKDFVVGEPGAVLSATVTSTQESCTGDDGTATVAAAGGNGGYSFLWSNDQNSATATGLSSFTNGGVYTVTVSDAKGCKNVKSVTITLNNPLAMAPITGPAVCTGTEFSITPQDGINGTIPAGTTYSWPAPDAIPGIGGLAAGTDSSSINGVLTNNNSIPQTVSYTVTPKVGVCVGNAADVTVTVTTTVNPNVTIDIPHTMTVCSNAEIFNLSATFVNSVSNSTVVWKKDGTTMATHTVTGDTDSYAIDLANDTCKGQYTYRVEYIDVSGCTASDACVITVNAGDWSISQPAGDTTVECVSAATEPAESLLPVVEDGCGRTTTRTLLRSESSPTEITCAGTVTYTYRYTACDDTYKDWTYTYTIEREDFEMPDNAGTTVACAADAVPPALPTVTDNCDNTLTGVLKSGYPTELTGCEGDVVYVYTFTDCAGHSHDWTYTYTIDRTIAPTQVGTPVSTESTVECLSVAIAPTNLPVVKDVCGKTLDAPTPVEGGTYTDCEGTKTYTYTYKDCSGLEYVWTYTYTIERTTAPAEVGGPVAKSSTVECIEDATAPTTLPVVKDVCGKTLDAPTPVEGGTYSETNCAGTKTYTYTYKDCAGLEYVWTYTYTIDRTIAPTQVGTPVETESTVECIADATAPTTLPVVKDVCENTLTAPTPVEGGTYTDCEGTKTYTYTYKDCAGLEYEWTYTYTIEHATAPTQVGGPVATESTVECIADATAPTTLPVVKDVCGKTLTAPTPVEGGTYTETNCAGTKTYTYTYKDCAGLEYVWTYTYTIDRTTAPSEDGTPVATESTVECIADATAPTTLPVVKDVCGKTLDAPTPVEGGTYTDCEGTKTYTYTYEDCAGLQYVWTYTYTIDRTTAPAEFGTPVAKSSTVECESAATAPTTLPVVKDVCGNTLEAPTPVVGGTYTDCEGTKTYAYTYKDCSGLEYVWTYTYTIDRTTAPAEVDGPVVTSSTVQCATAATAPTTLPVVKDVCGNTLEAPTPVVGGTYTDCEGTKTYTYTYKDCSGLQYVWTYTYTIEHTTAPAEVGGPVATSSTVQCIAAATAPTTLPVVKDVCGKTLEAPTPVEGGTYTDCEGTKTYTYTYKDCSGLEFVWTYTYTIDRTTAPAEVDGPVATSSTVQCAAAATAPTTLPVVKDVCGNTLTAPTPVVGGTYTDCEGTKTYTYTYEDCSGLQFVWTYTYTIDRTTAPAEVGTPVAKSSTVECESAATAPTTLPVVKDVCGNTLTAPTPVVGGTYTDCEGTKTYTYTYEDCSGLQFVWTYTYTIDRTTAPAEVGGPVATSSTVECAAAATAPTILPVVKDVCGNTIPAPTPVEGGTYTDCEGTKTYTYTYKDCAGLQYVWTYTYTIDRTTAPAEVGGPVATSSTVECESAAAAPTTLPVVKDVCGNTLTAPTPVVGGTYTDCEGTKTYTYTYKDCSGLEFVWTYTYTIDRTTAPSEDGTPVATSSTVECIADATAPTTLPVVKDVCGKTLDAPTPVEGGTYTDCEGTKTYTYTYKDCSGLEFVWTYTYTIERTTAPSEDGTPVATSSTVECIADATAPTTLPVVKDVCGKTLTAPTPVVGGTYTDCEGTKTYTYTYEDCAGLQYVWTYTYTITAPTLTFSGSINDVENVNACYSEEHKAQLLTADQVKAMYTSSCSREITVEISDNVESDNDCNWKITRTYNISDGGCNTDSKTMSVSGSDQSAPALTEPWPANITDQDNCLANADISGLYSNEAVKALYTDCSAITVSHEDATTGDDCGWTVTRTYTITDACGNTVSPAPTMSVSGSDRTAPAIGTDDLNRTLTSTNCVFRIPDLTTEVRNISNDVCTDNADLIISQSPAAGTVLAQTDAAQNVTVIVTVKDLCGNESTKEVVVVVPAKVTVMATATPATICYGATSHLTATPSNVVGTATYNWTPSDGLNNATIANPVATLTTTTTYTVEVTDENGCAATATTTVTVNPEVVMDTVAPMTLCVDDVTSYSFTTPLTVGTMSYAWTNSNTAIGLGANGDGDIPSFTPTNTTNAPINATISVTPSHTYNDITCVGDPINFTITVRPSITTPGNVTFTCPADTTVVLSYSDCEQLVNIGEPEFENHMSGMTVNITNDAPAGNIFPEGTTVVTWTATDECGAFLTCTQNVVIQFPPCGDSIADFDGYRYSSVRIGCQCWTGENARSEHYSDGTPVDNFRYYNDSDSLENIYGKLYTWYTAVRVPEGDNNAEPSTSTDPFGTTYVQGICPEGWALPTVNEYMLMIANSGDATHAKDGSNLYWLPGYEGQPPFSGFDAYGAGKYNGAIDRYQELLGKTYFWTTLSGSGSETATTVEINYYCAEGLQTELSKGDGVSIRCIRKR